VDAARSDGGKHRPHDQKHRPPVVDHGDDELVEIAAKRAMVQHGTQPTRSIGFSLAAARYWFVCKQSFNDDFETVQEAGKRPLDCNWPTAFPHNFPRTAHSP
jgi:hypothetical protein